MEATYKIIGSDGKEYGPVTLADIKTWIAHKRVGPQTQVSKSDSSSWSTAANFPELGLTDSAGPVSASTPEARTSDDPAAAATARSGASWFYWLAGLSLINSAIALFGGNWVLIFGLGITQVFDAIAQKAGSAGTVIAIVLDLMAAGVLVFFGVFATKGHNWAFILGMILYALDAALMVLFQDWLGAAVHGYVLFRLFTGFNANRALTAGR
jgi:hypothetical protein